MLITTATVLAGLIGAGIMLIGFRELWAPQASVDFGIPDTPAEDRTFHAWLGVKAVRDIAAGIFTFVLIAGATPHLLGWFMLAAAFIPFGDMLIVLRSNGPRATAFGVHGATAAVMLVICVLLLVG